VRQTEEGKRALGRDEREKRRMLFLIVEVARGSGKRGPSSHSQKEMETREKRVGTHE